MDKLKRKRTPLRMSFSKTLNTLKAEIDNNGDKGTILDNLTKLENLVKEIKVLDDAIIDFMAEDEKNDEASLSKELEDVENYSDAFITIKRRTNEILNQNFLPNDRVVSSNTENGTDNSNNSKFKRYKLPKLNIKPFDAQLINYLPFWAQFKKIHEDEELDECDKFQYLLQSVESGTRARDLLESYPITSENYPKSLKAFQERYGNKDILIEVYVREFLKLITVNVQAKGNEKLSLCDLVTRVEAHLRSLESMGLDIESNSAWLYPMVESCLPEDIIKAWQRCNVGARESTSISSTEQGVTKSNLTTLMDFLKNEVTGEERLQLARSGFQNPPSKDKVKKRFHKRDNHYPTTTGLFVSKELSCLFCGKPHESRDCVVARSYSLEQKRNKVREKNCCLKCLRFGHHAKVCRVFVKCHVCAKPHTELFCQEIGKRGETKNKNKGTEVVQNTYTNQQCSKEVALMTLEIIIKGKRKDKRVRALLDSGSQKSYILKNTAKELDLESFGTEKIAHTVFGGAQIEAKPHNKFKVEVSAPGNRSLSHTFEFLDQDRICGEIPRIPKKVLCKELKKNRLWLSDIGPGNSEIEVLIGSDFYGKILTGRVKQLGNGLTAIQTKIGWTVCGPSGIPSQGYLNSGTAVVVTNLHVKEWSVPDLWRLETIGINDPAHTLSKREEEELAHDMFIKQLTRNEDGRYRVGLPWICSNLNIPSNRNEAERRLFSTTRRLKKLNKFEDYDLVLREWQKENVIEEVSEKDLENIRGHYLCHHPVLKPNSITTSIRPVFDGSCKIGRAPALNDCLFKGPNLLEEIPAVLLRFREKAIAVVSDVRRAFLQVEIKEEDRHFLRFLWWENKEEIKVYQHNRVVFGITSSPFLLSAVIRYHLTKYPDLKEIAQKLQKSFYVDNCVTSVDSTSELEEFVSMSTKMMAEAKMDLRLWQFGPFNETEKDVHIQDKLVPKDLTMSVPVLGLLWNRQDDSLSISLKPQLKIENPSKRKILAITQGVFDPIGFLAPALLPAKLITQEAWLTKSDWDSPLPENLQKKFLKWYSELEYLQNLKIPRRVGYGQKKDWCIHTFCDASQDAYATVIFLRCEDDDKISVQLLGAKSRIAPKKKLTIPRLELLACVLGARFTNFVQQALDIFSVSVRYWSDSSTVLAWIRRNDQWGTFVGNRVREICKSLDWNAIVSFEKLSPIRWKFIPPTAEWWGGWWERLIRCVKNLLLRTLGSSTLNFEELMTVLCDVEATINKRPLTYLSEEPEKLIPITPASFLQDMQEVGVPDLDFLDAKKLQIRSKHCQHIRQQLRSKFRKEYLSELVQKVNNKGQTARKGDVVLIEMNNQKRQQWPLGTIIRTFPSRDGCARVAEVKTSTGVLVRPLRKLYPLEVSDLEDPIIQTVSKITTRSGRTIIKPKN